jgi:two-component system OmpR family sensor kinase
MTRTTTMQTTMTTKTTMTTMTKGRHQSSSARMRILGWYVGLLAVAFIAALLLQRAVLIDRVSSEADRGLREEVASLRLLADGIDPETGEPFAGDVAAIFDIFLERSVPLEGEGIVTIVGGLPYKSDITGAKLAASPLVGEWTAIDETVQREVETAEFGRVRYLAVPLKFEGDTVGVFVASIFMDDRLSAVDTVLRLGALLYGSIFVLASVLAWVAAGRILRPLRTLTETAESISETDWSRRIPVKGDDEIAVLSRTFNSMLDRLEETFATQRRFLDDAGHELRTPITVIRGNLELMGDDPEDRRQTIVLVTDELDRMARIVDDLLDLAKAEQPEFLQLQPLDLADLTHELVAKGDSLSDRPWIAEEVAEVALVADRQRITQAIMNLMRNALEHTPDGTPVSLGSRVVGDTARIWVKDTGPGIPAKDRERLFERFSSGSGERRSGRGAGLGLAIVKSIADAHGGRVELESAEGLGSTFSLVLPLRQPVKETA